MRDKTTHPAKPRLNLARFAIELVFYAVFVSLYFSLVLHFLGERLKWFFDHHRDIYALGSLALMGLQGIGLEFFTTWLVGVIFKKEK